MVKMAFTYRKDLNKWEQALRKNVKQMNCAELLLYNQMFGSDEDAPPDAIRQMLLDVIYLGGETEYEILDDNLATLAKEFDEKGLLSNISSLAGYGNWRAKNEKGSNAAAKGY